LVWLFAGELAVFDTVKTRIHCHHYSTALQYLWAAFEQKAACLGCWRHPIRLREDRSYHLPPSFEKDIAHTRRLGVFNLAENGTIYGYQNMGVYFSF
jgi:hypothetical protein